MKKHPPGNKHYILLLMFIDDHLILSILVWPYMLPGRKAPTTNHSMVKKWVSYLFKYIFILRPYTTAYSWAVEIYSWRIRIWQPHKKSLLPNLRQVMILSKKVVYVYIYQNSLVSRWPQSRLYDWIDHGAATWRNAAEAWYDGEWCQVGARNGGGDAKWRPQI